MGLCFSCRKSRLDTVKTDFINSATPLRVCEDGSKTDTNKGWIMANTVSNIKITAPIKVIVSKRKKRYTKDGFNLDLSYIEGNIIAMGYPAQKLEGLYRNDINEVVHFFDTQHPDHYKIYNLCSERSYDINKFHHRVVVYPVDDHNPPTMEIIIECVKDMHKWLSQDKGNVAAVHCKAGKGRTGVIVCCYLLFIKRFTSAQEALNFYGEQRTHDTKGVTIPSQRRYVEYYSCIVNNPDIYKPPVIFLKEIHLEPIPVFNGGQYSLKFSVYKTNNVSCYSSHFYEVSRGSSKLHIKVEECVPLQGDVKFQFKRKKKANLRGDMFRFWVNTHFINDEYEVPEEDKNGSEDPFHPPARTSRAMSNDESSHSHSNYLMPRTYSLASLPRSTRMLYVTFDKWGLDKAHKDEQHKYYSPDFKISLFFERAPYSELSKTERWCPQLNPSSDTASGSSGPDSSESCTPDDYYENECESVDVDECQQVGRYRLLSDPDFRIS